MHTLAISVLNTKSIQCNRKDSISFSVVFILVIIDITKIRYLKKKIDHLFRKWPDLPRQQLVQRQCVKFAVCQSLEQLVFYWIILIKDSNEIIFQYVWISMYQNGNLNWWNLESYWYNEEKNSCVAESHKELKKFLDSIDVVPHIIIFQLTSLKTILSFNF